MHLKALPLRAIGQKWDGAVNRMCGYRNLITLESEVAVAGTVNSADETDEENHHLTNCKCRFYSAGAEQTA